MNFKHSTKISITKLVATVVVVSLLAIGGFALYHYIFSSSNQPDTGGVSVTPAPAKLNNTDATTKQAYIESQQKQTNSTSSDKNLTANKPASIELTPTVSSTSVTLTTKIYSIGDGKCSLIAVNGARKYSAEAEIIYQPSYSTCAGFTVPISKLGSGTWNISLTVTSLDGATASTSTTVEIK